MSIIKHVTLQKTVAHDFRYGPRISLDAKGLRNVMISQATLEPSYITGNPGSHYHHQCYRIITISVIQTQMSKKLINLTFCKYFGVCKVDCIN